MSHPYDARYLGIEPEEFERLRVLFREAAEHDLLERMERLERVEDRSERYAYFVPLGDEEDGDDV